MGKNFERYCKDIENVENFEKAKADDFKGWEVHHRLETHNSDGERRTVIITVAELKALDMYYNRPSSELIFLTKSEHRFLHKKGKHFSEEHKKKLSEANKGEKNHNYGKQFSEEIKKKLSEAHKGKHLSEETKKKLSEAMKGKKGKPKSEETRKKMSDAKKNMSEETRKKMSDAKKGMCFFNNGKINIRAKECPDGFVPGKLLIYKETEK